MAYANEKCHGVKDLHAPHITVGIAAEKWYIVVDASRLDSDINFFSVAETTRIKTTPD